MSLIPNPRLIRTPLHQTVLRMGCIILGLGCTPLWSGTTLLVPQAYATQRGSASGQPVASSLDILDESGTTSNWDQYVEFSPTRTSYAGTQSFRLPKAIAPSSLTSLQLQINYRGPAKAAQTWTWSIYNWKTSTYASLGTNAAAPDWGAWKLLTFKVPGTLSNYVRTSDGAIQIQLTSNNRADSCDLDFEGLLVNYNSVTPISVTVAPATASVFTSAAQAFTATLTGTSNTAVTWQVNGITGGSSNVGTISSTGVYTAPVQAPTPSTVTIKAISAADPSKSGTASVSVQQAPAQTFKPAKLLVYYGYPSSLNSSLNAWDMNKVIADFAQYDVVVLGAGLEEETHSDHANTLSLLSSELTRNTTFYGYVDLGITNGTSNFTLEQIKQKIDKWTLSGADGIFLDDFGYDYGVTRSRQNEIVDYVHTKGLPLVANAWVPGDVFDPAYHSSGNPGSIAAHLNASDVYLCESYQITEGTWQSETAWQEKVTALMAYRKNLPFKVFALTTNDATNAWDEGKFHYAWGSAMLYGFDAMGWGEYAFAASSCIAPFRTPPTDAVGSYFTGEVTSDGHTYSRTTDTGMLKVDAATHTFGFEVR